MKHDNEELVKDFIANSIIQGQATYDGDYRKGNKASKRLFKIAELMKADTRLARVMIDGLMFHSEPNVKIWACGVALDIGYRTTEAESILTELASNTGLGILSLNAEMSLRVRKGTVDEFGKKPL